MRILLIYKTIFVIFLLTTFLVNESINIVGLFKMADIELTMELEAKSEKEGEKKSENEKDLFQNLPQINNLIFKSKSSLIKHSFSTTCIVGRIKNADFSPPPEII